jgi:hypothetical protein
MSGQHGRNLSPTEPAALVQDRDLVQRAAELAPLRFVQVPFPSPARADVAGQRSRESPRRNRALRRSEEPGHRVADDAIALGQPSRAALPRHLGGEQIDQPRGIGRIDIGQDAIEASAIVLHGSGRAITAIPKPGRSTPRGQRVPLS